MNRSLQVEWLKLRRSPVTATATVLMVFLLPLMALGFYSVAQNGGTGAIAQKADAFVIAEGWAGYLNMIHQIVAVAMFIGAGIVVSWAFGREHADRTFPSLFALPVSRASIAAAKFVVLGGWMAILAALVAVTSFGIGVAASIGPLEVDVIGPDLLRLVGIALGTCGLALTVGFVASVGKGYLPAIGALILVVAVAQISVLFGTGGWFPYTVPGLAAVAGSEGVPALGPIQIALVPVATAVGIWVTIRWWQRAEAA